MCHTSNFFPILSFYQQRKTPDEFINLSFQLVRLPAEFAHPNPELKFGKCSLPFPIESNVMAKASNPFPELVRSHGGVCIFPGIL